MYHESFAMFAAYNRWANERIYEAVGALQPDEMRAERGLFFGSLHGTLNHLLVTDRIWMKRFTGTGDAPDRLDAVLFEDFASLHEARVAEDERIGGWIGALDDADFSRTFSYRPVTNPRDITQPLTPALFHLFNHQTHHRGQCHAALTAMDRPSVILDMVAFQREAAG